MTGQGQREPAVRKLADILNLEKAVMTADVMHWQSATDRTIITMGANFVLQVKEIQSKFMHATECAQVRFATDQCRRRPASTGGR